MKDMDAFLGAIESSETKVATFLVPASIRMLLRFGDKRLRMLADKIDFIETGAAPMAQSDMEALCDALPNVRLYNTYASTETGIITTHDYNAGYCKAGCLGKPMKHAILNIDEAGFISCSGPQIMSGYIGDDATTNLVKKGNVIYTNDKGILDSEGRLQLSGREGDIINVGGFKVNPVEVEDAANSFPGIVDCVCVEDTHPVLGTALRLLYVSEQGNSVEKKNLGKFLMEKLERHKVPTMYSQVEKIQRTFNGKLDRKFYKKR